MARDIKIIEEITNKFDDEIEAMGIGKEVVDEAINYFKELEPISEYAITFTLKSKTNSFIQTSLSLPVTQEFFDSVEIGQELIAENLSGLELSEMLKDWEIIVIDKIIRQG